MTPATATFLFEAVNFMTLAAALGWFFFKPVRAALDTERDRWVKEERESEGQRARAETLAKEGQAALERAGREAERSRIEIVAAAEREATRIREEARQSMDEQRRTFRRELEASRQAEASALANALGRIAAASVRGLLEALDGPALDLALVRGACEALRALPQGAGDGATVESARPLDVEARRLLRDVLGTDFAERTVTELGAGVRITTVAGQVDASALALGRQAARDVAALVVGDAGTSDG